MNQKYPHLQKIKQDFPGTVIDDVWEEIISPEALAELKEITGLKSYEEILKEHEGTTVEEMLPVFYVDIPQCNGFGEPSEEMRNVESFDSREEAIKFAQEKFGADENGMVSLISQG